MAWIAITAARANARAVVAELRKQRHSSGVSVFREPNLIAAWIAGDPEAAVEEEELMLKLPELNPALVKKPSLAKFGTVATSAVLRRCEGLDGDAALKRLAGLKFEQDSVPNAIQITLKRILDQDHATRHPRKPGCVETARAFARLVDSAAPPLPAQTALIPDHPLYTQFAGAVVPLAYESLLAAGRRPTRAEIAAFVRCGADVRPREVLYERAEPAKLCVYREDPSEVPGFDAVEWTETGLIVHHYMGVRWQAPLLLDEHVDAYKFLAHIDAGWDIVRGHVSPESWAAIEQARAQSIVHRVSIDPVNAIEDPASTARAKQRYGVNLKVVSLFDA